MGLPVGPPQGGTPLLPTQGQPAPMKAGEYVPGSVPQLASFGISSIAPPSNLYIGRDDVLLLQGLTTNATGDTITVNIRMLVPVRPDAVGGQPDSPKSQANVGPPLTAIEFGAVNLTLAVGVLGSKVVPLAEGFLLSIAGVSQTTAARGITFMRATLLRGGSTAPFASLLIVSDYVTTTYFAGWPYGRIISSAETAGFTQEQTVANPAAGADWSFTIPTGAKWRIQSVSAQYAASATVNNRAPSIQILQSGVVVFEGTPNQVIVASTTAQVTYTSGSSPGAAANVTDVMGPLPSPCWISNALVIRSVTKNISAGDQWSNIAIWAEQFVDFDG